MNTTTCEDRNYECCEQMTPAEHSAKYGYSQAGAEECEEVPYGQEWCDSNECEMPSCHRCFPRKDCTFHEKCQEFTEAGDAYTESEIAALNTK